MPETKENELKNLIEKCHIIRDSLKKSIMELMEYTKAFEARAETKNIELESKSTEEAENTLC